MKQVVDLGGTWELQYKDTLTGDCGKIEATVPGNVELDLARAGLLPEDLFFGTNITLAEKYETYDWTYTRTFDCPDSSGNWRLVFEGVDCLAEYFVNGVKIGESRNMLVEHGFAAEGLRAHGNELKVVIRSTAAASNVCDFSLRTIRACNGMQYPEQVVLRRAAHTYGWDIMPRAIGGGIFGSVRLERVPPVEFKQLYLMTKEASPERAVIVCCYELSETICGCRARNITIEVSGKCGGSAFSASERVFFRAHTLEFDLVSPKLWAPKNYGEPNLYDVTVRVTEDGALLCEKRVRFGVRTVRLIRRDPAEGDRGEFKFVVNGTDVFVMGTNWVPLHPYHSQDKLRMERALNLLDESGCNAVRCWGGNRYEADAFYDFCDEKGILVWQDFAFACNEYPNDDAFLREVEEEARKVILRLRSHACIALWSGDNEIDCFASTNGMDPAGNIISREILPKAVRDHDLYRDYLPSSPFVSAASFQMGGALNAEEHLWGARNCYRDEYYASSRARFVSETGFHGSVCRESAERFLEKGDLETRGSAAFILHSTDVIGRPERAKLMDKQIKIFFGETPADFDRFARLSQIVQAESLKFMIENARAGKAADRGIIWWNLLDGWPQFSDAVVDFYFVRKLAFGVIVRSQQPVLLLCSRDDSGRYRVYASNDTARDVSLSYTVSDADSGEELASGSVHLCGGERKDLGRLPHLYAEKRLLLIQWKGDAEGCNHFVTGDPVYDADWLMKEYQTIEKLG